MYSFEFDSIIQLKDFQELNGGCFLCVWHADKIPPHIGISFKGAYYSLKVNGKDTAIPVNEIVKIINKKNISVVFIEIRIDLDRMEIERVFSNYLCAKVGESTCLSPITEICGINNRIYILADLLNYFKGKQQIGQLFGLNLKPDFKGILPYGREEIEARLKQLSEKTSRNV
jgi:hypothetical protein